MGALQKLVFILGKLDPDNERWKETQLAKLDDVVMQSELERIFRENYNDYGRKLYLIENCIYGVDSQPIAVQIAKLRFFISLVVDQKINENAENRGIRPLPNLETKFVAANSLLAVERPRQMGLVDADETLIAMRKELKKVRHRYFSARTPATKEKYRARDKELRAKLSRALQNNGFPQASARQLTQWDPYDQNVSADFFDPEWMFTFSANEGFDVVIGNPPYVRQEKLKELKPALQAAYECYTGTADLYVYFFECGFQALKAGGVLSYISSNKYFRAGYGRKLRTYLRDKSTIRRLIDFGDAPVFSAIAYPSIIVLVKAKPHDNRIQTLTWEAGPPISDFPEIVASDSFALPQEKLTPESWRLEPPVVLRLLERLRRRGVPLGDYVKGRLYRGILTGLNDAFVVPRADRDRLIAEDPASAELLKPFLRGRDVKRWTVEFADQYLIKIESSENKTHPWSGQLPQEAEAIFARTYPAIYAWFEGKNHSGQLIKRWDQGQYFWELRACAYWEEFEQPKILYQEIATYQAFAWDQDGFYTNNKSFLIPNSSYYLLALLNSAGAWFFMDKVASKLQGGAYAMQTPYVSQIPIPQAASAKQTLLETLVGYILYLKQHAESPVNPHVPNDHIITLLEEALNGCVYELYFPEAVQAQQVNVIDLIREHFSPIDAGQDDVTVRARIEAGYQALRAPQGEIRNRLIKQKIVVDEIKLITEELAK
ncbi:MAG: TaqI-like C-terminal specificity domain-containing protein [Caldilineaceae bacterium]